MSTVLVTSSDREAVTVYAGSTHERPADRLYVATTTPSDTVTLCAVAGEVDCYTADFLRITLLDALNAAAPTVVVDLSKVTFFGVAGLQVLLQIRDRTERSARTLRLVTGPRCVNRLLELARGKAQFDTMPDLATAVLGAP